MAERTQAQLQTEINTEITANGNQEITGPDLNIILTDFNDTLFSNSIVRIVSITRADLITARDANQLIRGRLYLVTDSVVPLILQAVAVNLLRKWALGVSTIYYNEIIEYDIDTDTITFLGQPMTTVQVTLITGQLDYSVPQIANRTIKAVQFENMPLVPIRQYVYDSSGAFTLVFDDAEQVQAGMYLIIFYT